MSIIYRFRSLNSFADWCENKSRELADRTARTKLDGAFNRGEACAWFSIADMLRSVEIRADDPADVTVMLNPKKPGAS